MNKYNLLDGVQGFRDYFPEDWDKIDFILNNMKFIARRYGYVEYEGPSIEATELIEAKSGEGLITEIFTVNNRENRRILLRPEQTPTLARMLAKNQQKYKRPIRWFSIPRLFRDETVQKGRVKEFWQLNVDCLGDDSMVTDAEIISVAVDILRECGLKDDQFSVLINNRKLLNTFLNSMDGVNSQKIISVIDKKMSYLQDYAEIQLENSGMTKKDASNEALKFRRILNSSGEFKNELLESSSELTKSMVNDIVEITKSVVVASFLQNGLQQDQANELYKLTSNINEPTVFIDNLKQLSLPPESAAIIDEFEELVIYLKSFGVIDTVIFDASLARGLDYYTGFVFEVFESSGQLVRALCGGGRYSDLVESLGGTNLSGVGFGMGDLALLETMKILGLDKSLDQNKPEIYIAPIKKEPIPMIIELAARLRKNFSVMCNPFTWKLNRHFDTADTMG
ncbi:MAG: ATP phosphoribosyltransferase regulatory subunit, partial [Candidatus Heimdallarchaeota archaeon]|nr:ATP phosphoribosyltransferase regulatory subunit [Candidatus Heimdallarchaeota archaeon]